MDNLKIHLPQKVGNFENNNMIQLGNKTTERQMSQVMVGATSLPPQPYWKTHLLGSSEKGNSGQIQATVGSAIF